jgi:N-acetylmuramoyl-L-alanine amidase
MNRKVMMKRLSIIAVIIACAISFFILLKDSQSEIGILNSLSREKVENNIREESVDVTHSNEKQGKQLKDLEDAVKTEEPVAESSEVTNKAMTPPTTNTESFVIVIDPGHQAKANLEQEPIGPDARETKYKVTGGTMGVATGKPEYVLTLEASNLLKAHLEKKGFRVILTRTSHDVDISNQERAEIANMHGADLFVRLHADGSESAETSGFSVLVPAKDNPYTAAIYEDSYRAAQTVLTYISKEIPIHQNGLFFRNDMSGFNWSKVPVILPEIGFMTNPEEDKKLSDEAYLTHVMELLASGIEEYVKEKSRTKDSPS